MIGLIFRCLHILIAIMIMVLPACSKPRSEVRIIPGAEQSGQYLHLLEGKSVGLLVNQTSVVEDEHLIDFLISKGVKLKCIFAAEHGIRGAAEAGEHIDHGIDQKTNLPIYSLHGNSKKPERSQLLGVDVIIFDIQDVGCRFYTYISTMHYMMEACAENGKKLIVLDRPNPNGDYIDGPVLDLSLASFVGMHPIPVVHGCTVGELAMMINGERWLNKGVCADLTVVPVKNYSHKMRYSLPVRPSPNLPNDLSVRLYPSLCLFEATNVSIGRGTGFPFQAMGYPRAGIGCFEFTPVSIEGMSKSPLHQNKVCYGDDLRQLEIIPTFTLSFFLDFFERINDPDLFWSSRRWIELLMGDKNFYQQVNDRWSEEKIRATWQVGIDRYKEIRKKYLLYPDFE